jgi:hypothetical protein
MKKVLILMALLAIIATVPAMAYQHCIPNSIDPNRDYWKYQWYTGFDDYTAGALAHSNVNGQTLNTTGQDGWVAPQFSSGTDFSGTVVNTTAGGYTGPAALSGNNVYQAGPGGSAASAYANSIDMKAYNNNILGSHTEGFVEFWMYDPRGTGTAVETDSRGWVYSSVFQPSSIVTASSYTWGATLGDSRISNIPGASTGKQYWIFAAGGNFGAADGSGGTFTSQGMVVTAVAGQARVRTQGWHQVQLYWNFAATTARLEMYVDDMMTP